VDATKPKYYTEYNPAYYATFFEDPDHMRLEIVCKTPYRQALQDDWNDLEGFLNPSIQLPPKNAEA